MARRDLIDLTGQQIGEWYVLEYAGSVRRVARFRCRCSCGAVKVVRAQDLRLGRSKSCRGPAHRHRAEHTCPVCGIVISSQSATCKDHRTIIGVSRNALRKRLGHASGKRAAALRRVLAGESVLTIAAALGVSHQRVHQLIAARNPGPARKAGRPAKYDVRKITEQRERREQWRAEGKCSTCGGERDDGYIRCSGCRAKARAKGTHA